MWAKALRSMWDRYVFAVIVVLHAPCAVRIAPPWPEPVQGR